MSSKKIKTKTLLIFEKINQILAYFSGVLLSLITLAIFAEIIARKLWTYSIMGVIECSEYAIVFITFLSAAWVLKDDAHIKVDIVLDWLKPRTRAFINMATSFFGAILSMFIACRSALIIWDLWRRGLYTEKTLEFPMAPLYIPMFLGLVMLSVEFFRRALGYLVERKNTMGTE